jgi:para-aminobenzoate synthetase
MSIPLGQWVDPAAAFVALSAGTHAAAWLDASRAEPGLARFSFLAFADAQRGAVVRYRSATRSLTIQRGGHAEMVRQSLFDYLEHELQQRAPDPSLPFRFQGGPIGYFGYELKGECGAQVPYQAVLPDAAFLIADHWLVFDHELRIVHLCSTAPDPEWCQSTAVRLRTLPAIEPYRANIPQAHFRLARSRNQYLADVDRCHSFIHEGESYELCLTNQIHVKLAAPVDPLALYLQLRRINPAPYAAFLSFGPECGSFSVLSSSPERFLSIDAEGWVETKPIKGTRRRGATPEEDARLRDELRTSTKDRAENLMITDLMRNDLGRVCDIGSVTVPHLMNVETYATVHQLVSTVRGHLRADQSTLDCIRAAFPGGSMTGAPKMRTMSLLDELERAPRGIYSGGIGYLSAGGAADLSIAIRTIVASGNHLSLGTGGAIVALSERDAEFEETLLKARAQVAAIVAVLNGNQESSSVEGILHHLRIQGEANWPAGE